VTGSALRLILGGIVLGTPLAWVASRYLGSMLFGVQAMDPGVILGSMVTLGLAGMLAAYFPARRATRVDPVHALRHE